LLKIVRRLLTGEQPFRQKPGCAKPGLYGARCILFSKQGSTQAMPIFKHFSVAGSALLALLFVSDALFGDNSRFDGSLYESATYAPRLVEIPAIQERQFTRDGTPADRVKEVFAQFVPNEGRRGKRYSAI
jgi:hypothetical protein